MKLIWARTKLSWASQPQQEKCAFCLPTFCEWWHTVNVIFTSTCSRFSVWQVPLLLIFLWSPIHICSFLSGKTDRVWLSFQNGYQVKLKVYRIWRWIDIAVQYRCTAGLPVVIPLQQIAWHAVWWGLQQPWECQESWTNSAPCIFHTKIAHFSFVSVDMTDDVTMCAFWQGLSKVFLKDIAMACLRCYLTILLYELNKSLFCSPLVRVEGR